MTAETTGATPSPTRDDALALPVMDGPGAANRRELTKQRNRDRLYDAAMELFGARGYDEVSVEDICAHSGVGRATFFRLYGTKGGLLGEFNRRLAVRARCEVGDRPGGDAVDALRIVARCMCDAWSGAGAAVSEMAREYMRTVSLEAGTRRGNPDLQALVAGIVADGQRSGELVDQPGPGFVAWVVLAALSSAIATWLGDAGTLTRRTDQTLQLLFTGLRADRAS